jgi:type II restriction enzyme
MSAYVPDSKDVSPYSILPGVKSKTDALKYFFSTLLPTNRGWGFYVDWEKVHDLVNERRVELGILESILDAPEEVFKSTIQQHPEIVSLFPRLLAVGKGEESISVLLDPISREYLELDASTLQTTDGIDKSWTFWKESGLSKSLQTVKSLRDYYLGVEVGTDTNARKNRGGNEWENLIEPLIQQVADRNGCKIVIRSNFAATLREAGFEAPAELHRNFDFLLFKDNRFIDIEANFFSGSGTKLEVPGAYVNRTNKKGFYLSLILFTDGMGWNTAQQRVAESFVKFPCVVNYNMAALGVLERAVQQLIH